MKSFLAKIRQKSDAEKTMYAFVSAAILTFVIASTWFTWVVSKEEKEALKKEDHITEEVTPISNLGSQFSEIKEMIGEFNTQYKESKEILNEIKQVTSTTTETTDYSSDNSTTTSEIESSVQ